MTTSLTTVTTQSDAVQVMTVFSDVMGAALVWGLVLDVVRCVVHLIITNYILSRRLNLE